jgi:hypothetical protein
MLLFRNQPSFQNLLGKGGGGGRGRFPFFVNRVPTFLQEVCLRRKLAHVTAYDAYFHLDALLPTGIK